MLTQNHIQFVSGGGLGGKMNENSQYFEATVQVRNPTGGIMDFIRKETSSRKGIFISGMKRISEGVDFNISSQHFAQSLGRKLQQRFGGELKITKRLFSRNRLTSREVYRVTVYYKPGAFKIGDVVKVGGKIIRVTNLGKGNIVGENLVVNKKINLDIKNRKIEVLEVKKAVVSKTCPKLEVIHPETYQPVEIANQKKVSGKEIKVVVSEDKVFAL